MYLSNNLDDYYKNKFFIVVDEEDFTDEQVNEIKKQITNMSDARIVMERHIALKNPAFFEKLCKAFPGVDIFVKVDDIEYDVNFMESQIFTKEEMNRLFENFSVISKNNVNLYMLGYTYGDDPYDRENKIPFSKVIQANSRMNHWVDKINNAKVDGKPLSPLEKYLYAYQIVTQFKYTQDHIFEARDISRVLSSKFIVCAGYSSILSELCRRVGIVCKRQFVHTDDSEMTSSYINHEGCMLYLKDKKYGVDGFFFSDPTLDSFDSSIEEGTSITFGLIDLNEYDALYEGKDHLVLDGDDSDFSNFYFLRDAKAIPYEKTFAESEKMLVDISDSLKNGYFDESFGGFVRENFDNLPSSSDEWEGIKTKNGTVFDKIQLGEKSCSVDEISNDSELLTMLALKFYSVSAFPKDENYDCLHDFYIHSLSKFIDKHYLGLNNQSKEKVIELMLKTAKTNENIYDDAQILLSLADYNDFLTMYKCGSHDKIHEIMVTKNKKSPTLENYKDAMTQVYRANGNSREEAKKLSDFMINSSVWVADNYCWGDKDVSNPFAVEAQKTKPIETIRKMEIEEFVVKLGDPNITVEKIEELINSHSYETLDMLGLDRDVYADVVTPVQVEVDTTKKRARFNNSREKYIKGKSLDIDASKIIE